MTLWGGRQLRLVAVMLMLERNDPIPGGRLVEDDAQFSPDATMVATCGRDGTARLWDATSGRQLPRVVTDDLADGCTVAFSPDGNLLAVADPDAGTWVFAVHLEDVAGIAARKVVRPFTVQECRDLLNLDACSR